MSENNHGRSAGESALLARTEEALSPAAKVLRRAFIDEYLKDLNFVRAMRRLGYDHEDDKRLRTQAEKWTREPFVQQEMMRRIRALEPTDVVTRGQVMMRMWEEANDATNDGSTRVAALAHTAKMLGMYNKEEDNAPTFGQGVMMIPVMNLDDWSATSIVAQEKLKQSATSRIIDMEPDDVATEA
jgi:hypothetical protein